MAKLTKNEVATHKRALQLLSVERDLIIDECVDVIEGYNEGATQTNTQLSAIFTPFDLARHAAIEVSGPKILDMCAGIGGLSVAYLSETTRTKDEFYESQKDLVLLEICAEYAAVARKLLPGAEVIEGSMYDTVLVAELAARSFDTVISNPPFGSFSKQGERLRAPRYRGGQAHYDTIDIASDIADQGVFILPQTSVPFTFSGKQNYTHHGGDARYREFSEATSIELTMNCGIDTSVLPKFRSANILTEIALADFKEARRRRAMKSMPLFALEAA